MRASPVVAAIAGLAELTSLPVLHVVHERRRALDAHRLEFSFGLHLPWEIALAGEHTRAAVVAVAFDEIDLGFLARLDDPEVVVVEAIDDDPRGNSAHEHTP